MSITTTALDHRNLRLSQKIADPAIPVCESGCEDASSGYGGSEHRGSETQSYRSSSNSPTMRPMRTGMHRQSTQLNNHVSSSGRSTKQTRRTRNGGRAPLQVLPLQLNPVNLPADYADFRNPEASVRSRKQHQQKEFSNFRRSQLSQEDAVLAKRSQQLAAAACLHRNNQANLSGKPSLADYTNVAQHGNGHTNKYQYQSKTPSMKQPAPRPTLGYAELANYGPSFIKHRHEMAKRFPTRGVRNPEATLGFRRGGQVPASMIGSDYVPDLRQRRFRFTTPEEENGIPPMDEALLARLERACGQTSEEQTTLDKIKKMEKLQAHLDRLNRLKLDYEDLDYEELASYADFDRRVPVEQLLGRLDERSLPPMPLSPAARRVQRLVEESQFHLPKDLMFAMDLRRRVSEESANDVIGAGQIESKLLIEARHLFLKGADLNKTQKGGMTLLMEACMKPEYLDCVQFLARRRDAGVDLEITERNGRTALLVATRHNNIGAVKILIKNGARCDHKDRNGWSCPMLSARYCSEHMMAYLSNFMDINDRLPSGMSVLMKAVRYDKPKVTQFLLSYGADMMVRDKAGNTALMVGARYNRQRPVKQILERSSLEYLQLRNNAPHSRTAREIAKDNGNGKVEALIRRREIELRPIPSNSRRMYQITQK